MSCFELETVYLGDAETVYLGDAAYKEPACL